MQWQLIQKNPATYPKTGTYKQWKALLAEEGHYQCVYCCIHENRFGGSRNFHVEHWRPKSTFPLHENNYENLFYACGICNSFKGNDWPNEPVTTDLTILAYPDPSKVDYSQILQIEGMNGFTISPFPAGKYLIERTYLNRPQMVTLRIMTQAIAELRKVQSRLEELDSADCLSMEQQALALKFVLKLSKFFDRFAHARPYSPQQISRA